VNTFASENAGASSAPIEQRSAAPSTTTDQPKSLHELQAHLLELERQNDALRKALSRAETLTLHHSELFNSAPVGYFILQRNSHIQQLNVCAAKLLGVERTTLSGLTFASLVTHEHRDIFNRFLEGVFESNDKQTCEITLQIGENAQWVRIVALVEHLKQVCFAVIIDSSAQKPQERELQQKIIVLINQRQRLEQLAAKQRSELKIAWAKAEAANDSKNAFLANMGHEILTPMHAILGFTQLLRNRTEAPEQLGYLEKIAIASQHLLSIIHNVLDLAKIEVGHLEVARDNFTLEDILYPVQSIAAAQAAAKGLPIEVVQEVGPQWLQGDLTRLRQILLNYVENAIKFTEQGSICLKVNLLGQNKFGLLLRFEVQDSGIGIAEELLPSLFESFTQADASSSRHYGGTGVGLTINRSLANIMGGEVGAESTVGQGSTFWFTVRLKWGEAVADDKES
jgi:PAS domain S-box-containing protein